MSHIEEFRELLVKSQLDGFLVPSDDEFFNEYTPAYNRRLEWISGFSGSNGIALILSDKAYLFTDGRYILQAQQELNLDKWQIYNITDFQPWQLIKDNQTIGYDPKIMRVSQLTKYNCTLKSVENFIDQIWLNKPVKTQSQIFIYPEKYSGLSKEQKISLIASKLEDNQTLVLTLPESICWLLNIRAQDIPYTPFLLCYAILYKDETVKIFADNSIDLGEKVVFYPIDTLSAHIAELQGKEVILDPVHSSVWFQNKLSKSILISKSDPCLLEKAKKHDVEIEQIQRIHIEDGIALCKLLCWLEENYKSTRSLTELDVSDQLLKFRQESKSFVCSSFATISAWAENSAIVHYHPSEHSNKSIKNDNIFLLDSGGQYWGGTTDVTRTICLGTPTLEQKELFTRVLKGHIAVTNAHFPNYVTGAQLDVLARSHLWQIGLDYDHGTGHGVGNFLSVHEGPHRISKAYNGTFYENMVVSIEPGVYLNNKFGIRIENLVVVKKLIDNILGFMELTLVPIDQKLILTTMLTNDEIDWINSYHKKILDSFKDSKVDDTLWNWVVQATAAISKK